jgi:hypothetical protein
MFTLYSTEEHGFWDTLPELTVTSPYVDSRVDSSHMFHAIVDFILQSGTLEFGLCTVHSPSQTLELAA